MFIPNVHLVLLDTNRSCSVKTVPRYVAALYKAHRGKHLDKEKGIQVVEIKYGCPDRYRAIESIAAEESIWRQMFKEVFNTVYPNGLAKEIEAELRADALVRAQASAQARAVPQTPHPSFLAAGCNEAQAVALQSQGWKTLAELPESFLSVAEAEGVTPDMALALVEKAKAAREAPATKTAKG